MRVRFWGTRGSIPTPGPATVRYGGNTSCVEVRTDSGTLLVLDCGTGARPLGEHLLEASARGGAPATGSILIGHTHWDHIQGLPFFAPLFQPGGRWDVYGPRGLGSSLAQTLAGQMQYQYFPVSLDQLGAAVAFHDLVEGRFEIGDVIVRTRYLNHPALTLGYRIEADGAVLAYLADHEPHDPELAEGGAPSAGTEDGRHVEFLAGADVLIHDSQYLAAEYAAKRGWGHSTVEHVVDLAIAGGVGRLVLFHHDPGRDDDAVDAVLASARARSAAAGGPPLDAAAEGAELLVEPGTGSPRAHAEVGPAQPATPADGGSGARVGPVVTVAAEPRPGDGESPQVTVAARAGEDDAGVAEPVPVAGGGPGPDAGGLQASTVPALEDLDVVVVVAVADTDLAEAVIAAASAEDLRVRVLEPDGDPASTARHALPELASEGRAVVVTDLVDGDGVDPLGILDAAPSSRVAVLAVARRLPRLASVTAAITDWVVWPATTTHLRTKLRAAVLRRACRWLAAPVPNDEERRLRSLRELALLDTPPEERFDRLTERARQLFGVPTALITLVDADRQWFKSRIGAAATESPRDESVCAHAILCTDVLQVPDLLDDDRFADNPAVSGGDRARFYAGAPLRLSDGSCVGTLCVVDHRPRLLDDVQLEQLRSLAHEVEAELERSS